MIVRFLAVSSKHNTNSALAQSATAADNQNMQYSHLHQHLRRCIVFCFGLRVLVQGRMALASASEAAAYLRKRAHSDRVDMQFEMPLDAYR